MRVVFCFPHSSEIGIINNDNVRANVVRDAERQDDRQDERQDDRQDERTTGSAATCESAFSKSELAK